MDKAFRLAGCSRRLEQDSGMDRAPQTESRSSHASFVSARCYKSFPRPLSVAALHFAAAVGWERKSIVNSMLKQAKTRRKFLKMLGASPLIAGSGIFASSLAELLHAAPLEEKHLLGWLENVQQSDEVISSPDQALDVMEFEAVARKICRPRTSAISRRE